MVSIIIALLIAIGFGIFFGYCEKSIGFGFFMSLGVAFSTVLIAVCVGTFNTSIVKIDEYDIYHAGNSIYYLNETQEMKELKDSYNVSVGDVDKAILRIKYYDETYLMTLDKKEIVIPDKIVKE